MTIKTSKIETAVNQWFEFMIPNHDIQKYLSTSDRAKLFSYRLADLMLYYGDYTEGRAEDNLANWMPGVDYDLKIKIHTGMGIALPVGVAKELNELAGVVVWGLEDDDFDAPYGEPLNKVRFYNFRGASPDYNYFGTPKETYPTIPLLHSYGRDPRDSDSSVFDGDVSLDLYFYLDYFFPEYVSENMEEVAELLSDPEELEESIDAVMQSRLDSELQCAFDFVNFYSTVDLYKDLGISEVLGDYGMPSERSLEPNDSDYDVDYDSDEYEKIKESLVNGGLQKLYQDECNKHLAEKLKGVK